MLSVCGRPVGAGGVRPRAVTGMTGGDNERRLDPLEELIAQIT